MFERSGTDCNRPSTKPENHARSGQRRAARLLLLPIIEKSIPSRLAQTAASKVLDGISTRRFEKKSGSLTAASMSGENSTPVAHKNALTTYERVRPERSIIQFVAAIIKFISMSVLNVGILIF